MPLESDYSGPAWLTAGAFGPEEALLCQAVVAISLVVFIRLARRSGRWLPNKTRSGVDCASGTVPGSNRALPRVAPLKRAGNRLKAKLPYG